MTTNPALPPAWDTLEEALRQRRPVRLTYHGRRRTVCPHALGWKNNKAMLLAYQTGGHTSTGALPADPRHRWRNLLVDDIDHPSVVVDPASPWQTADNYNASQAFNSIDHIAIAIAAANPPQLGTTRRAPKNPC